MSPGRHCIGLNGSSLPVVLVLVVLIVRSDGAFGCVDVQLGKRAAAAAGADCFARGFGGCSSKRGGDGSGSSLGLCRSNDVFWSGLIDGAENDGGGEGGCIRSGCMLEA